MSTLPHLTYIEMYTLELATSTRLITDNGQEYMTSWFDNLMS